MDLVGAEKWVLHLVAADSRPNTFGGKDGTQLMQIIVILRALESVQNVLFRLRVLK